MKKLTNIKENEIIFADFETSYINEEQITIGSAETIESRREMKKRERYVNVVGLMGIDDREVTLIENGEKTMQDFIDYLIARAKTLYKKSKNKNGKYKKIVVYFHNLDYDWSYIQYFICNKYNGIRQKTNSISYDELRDEGGIYSGVISLSTEVKEKNYKKIKDKKYQKHYSDGEEIKKYKSIDIFFYDTYKLFPMPLRKMGEMVDHKKASDKYDVKKIRDYNYRLTEEEKIYIKSDVLIMQKFYKYVPSYSTDKMTLASNCMTYYKKLLLDNPIIINGYKYTFEQLFMQDKNTNYRVSTFLQDGRINERYRYTWNELCEIYQPGYTGGITQVNEIFQGKFVVNKDFIKSNEVIKEVRKKGIPYIKTDKKEVIIDVNSLYPSIMYTTKIPYGIPKIYTYPSEKFIKDNIKDKVIFCKIVGLSGELKDNKLPIIPKHRNLKQGTSELYHKTIFNKTFFVNYEEFLIWKEHYNIYNDYIIEECLIFDSVRDVIFKDYIDIFYEMKRNGRATGDKVMEKIAKLFLNSLYGKYGTNPKRKHIKSYYSENGWTNIINEQYYYKDENGEKHFEYIDKDGSFIYPFLASAVTSYARIFLINCIDKLPYEKFIYCDTDSIHFIDNDIYGLKEFKKDGLISKDKMMKYSIEDTSMCSIYLAPKKYSYIDAKGKLQVKCAGLPDDAKENIKNITDFYYGYTTTDKKSKQRIKGGYDLIPTLYQIKPPKEMKISYMKIDDAKQI